MRSRIEDGPGWPLRVAVFASLMLASSAEAVYPGTALRYHPGHYLISQGASIAQIHLDEVATNARLQGISRVYNWIDLEGDTLGSYDFAAIQTDLDALAAIGKRLVIMIRDKSFSNDPFIPVPLYMRTPAYADGYVGTLGAGFVAKRWVPEVGARYRALMQAIAAQFADNTTLEAVRTAESATGPPATLGPEFTAAGYANQLMLLIDTLAAVFPNTVTVMYLNWFPSRTLLADIATHARGLGVGIGGPDVHPDVAIPAYPLYPLHHGVAPLMVDVQWSDYDHVVPAGDTDALMQFAVDSLFVDYICWQQRPPYEAALLATVANTAWDAQFPGVPAPPDVPLLPGPLPAVVIALGLVAVPRLARRGPRLASAGPGMRRRACRGSARP